MTLADLLARTRKCDDCLEWTGAVLGKAAPVFTIKSKKYYVRRYVMQLTGHQIEGKCVILTCGDSRCINPHHLRVVDRGVIVRRTAASGAYSGLDIKMKMAALKRLTSKLSQQSVQEIRESVAPATDMARQYQISPAYVYMIRRHLVRLDYRNPFVGLML